MKKGYYICYATGTDFVGVDKKIENQTRIFQKFFDFEKIVIKKEKTNFIKSVMWRMPFGSFGRNYEEAFDKISNPDFIYIRFVPVDRKFLEFIKKLRKRYSKVKLILEIVTYPYAHELLSNFSMLPFYLKDLFYTKKLKGYIDRVVTFSDDDYIAGIQTIKTSNGIIVDDIKMISNNENNETINLLALGIFQKSHGYERCIEALNEYKMSGGTRKIVIHMVGDGTELAYYKELTSKYHLQNEILFYGKLVGRELDNIYEKMDIALGCFGLYKRGIKKSSALKIREYLAKGLPVVSGAKEDAFLLERPYFYYEFPNDSSTIDMEKIVCFYDEIYGGKREKESVHKDVRAFAKKNVDMVNVMKPIIRYIDCTENRPV